MKKKATVGSILLLLASMGWIGMDQYYKYCKNNPSDPACPVVNPTPTPTPEPTPSPSATPTPAPTPVPTPTASPTPGPTPTPIPTPTPQTSCWADEYKMVLVNVPETKYNEIKLAMEQVRYYSGSPKAMLEKLAAQLNLNGECAFAGQEAVFTKSGKRWVETHAVYFNDGIEGRWLDPGRKYIGTHEVEGGSGPPPATCAPTAPDLTDFNAHCVASRKWDCDATPQVHGCGYMGPNTNFCADIGLGTMPGNPNVVRCDCPAGNEDDGACREFREHDIIGRPGPAANALWKSDGVVEVNPDNHLQARCTGCTWIQVCKADGTHCTQVTY